MAKAAVMKHQGKLQGKLNGAFLAVLVLGLLETLAWGFFRFAGDRFAFPNPQRYRVSPEVAERAQARFDAALGWRMAYDHTPWGERPRGRDHGRPFLAVFGDSFTHGDEVGHGETWSEALAARFEADVLNFGVSAYGMDQALLRMEAIAGEVGAPYNLLAFIAADLERNASVYWRFLQPESDFALTKPRFVVEGEGLRLLPNPVERAADLPRLLSDPAFLRRIGRNDHWYNRRRLPELAFPHLGVLLHPRFLAAALSRPSQADPWDEPELLELTERILARFDRASRERGQAALFLHLPVVWEVTALADTGYRSPCSRRFREICERRDLRCLTVLDELAAADAPDVERLYTRGRNGGHFTPEGHRFVAEVLRRQLPPCC